MIYLCSDGYYDQFGGDKGLKFFSVNFRKLLLEIHHLPAKEQLGILEHTIEKWRGKREQVDDMLVIGLRMVLEKEPVIASTKVYGKQRVLIAEDTEMNYFLLFQALKSFNVHIFRASNGKEAVEFCKANEVDLILMDINMPVMDGEEATKEIRTFNQTIPIIAQTALDLPGQKDHLIEIGCNDYISKPIDLQLFISIIKKYIEI
ncbi:MAG TPA: response regulator [Bacteroidales bacterium]|nr:response regulator [Bacteroidales bacterium]